MPFSLPDIVLIKKIHTDKKGAKQQPKVKVQKQGQKVGQKTQKVQGQGSGTGKGKKKEKVSREKKNGGGGSGEEEGEEEEEDEGEHMTDTVMEGEEFSGVKNGAEGGSKRTGTSRSHSAFGEYDDDDEREFEEFLLDINEEEEEDEDDGGDGGSDEGEEGVSVSLFFPYQLFLRNHFFHVSLSRTLTFNHFFPLLPCHPTISISSMMMTNTMSLKRDKRKE